MALIFPNTPITFREFWESLARMHKKIGHNPENKLVRFFEMAYLDFPYEDWDLSEYTDSVNARVSLSASQYPDAQAMAILSFEVDGKLVDQDTIPVSLFFFKVPKSSTTAQEKHAAKRLCYEETYATALTFRRFIRKYFKGVTEFGTLESDSFRFINIRMPDTSNPMYGTRLDFRYRIFKTKCHEEEQWLIDPLAEE
jgi:hypothetical protein